MRIINGHDYYDSGLAYGHDPKVVFVRGEEEVDVGERPNAHNPHKNGPVPYKTHIEFSMFPKGQSKLRKYQRPTSIQSKRGKIEFAAKRVIFCGKMYSGLKAYINFWDYKHGPEPYVEYFWNKETFETFLAKHGMEVEYETQASYYDEAPENDIFKPRQLTGIQYDWLIENRISIAIQVNRGPVSVWRLNCAGLKELQFYKVFDAVSAFQELDMWMSGALGMPGNPMVEISDTDRIAKHGYDKWSFRKKVR